MTTGATHDHYVMSGVQSKTGATYDHVVIQAPSTVNGHVSDATVKTTTVGSGPQFDHNVVGGPPGSSVAPINDDWLSPTANTNSGPQFDHRVLGLVVPDWNHGPCYDSWPGPGSLSKIGPVLDGLISKIPDHIGLGDTDPNNTPPERNRIVPQLVEFDSPGVVKLEKDLEGKIRGFKF